MPNLKLIACSIIIASSAACIKTVPSFAEATKASVCSNKFSGKKTASGHSYKPGAMTAASKHLPLGSQVLVKNKKNGKCAHVTITDRGPFVKGRGLDLSKGAADKIGVKGVGAVDVKATKIAHSGGTKHH